MQLFIGLLVFIVVLALLKTGYDVFILKRVAYRVSTMGAAPAKRSAPARSALLPVAQGGNPQLRVQERRMLELINQERCSQRLDPSHASMLHWAEDLALVARYHSADMAKRGYFSHNSPEGADHVERLRKFGVHAVMSGENISRGCQTVEEAHAGFMRSPGHRANCMDHRFEHVGIVEDPDYGGLVITQVFIRKA